MDIPRDDTGAHRVRVRTISRTIWHGGAMLLANGGNVAQIPPIMAQCRLTLTEQAGVEPSFDTTSLYD
jgi:hypothetical protein